MTSSTQKFIFMERKKLGFERKVHENIKFQVMFYRTPDTSIILIPFKMFALF